MHPRRLLQWIVVATVVLGPARLASQRPDREYYYPRVDYGAMQDRIRASVDRALERSNRAIERSARVSRDVAERAAERARESVRMHLDDRRYFDSDAFDRRMDRMRERMDRRRDEVRERVRDRVRDYRRRW
jgi:hypothetical protein